MSTSSSLRQQFGAFCTNVPLGVRTLLEAPGLTTTLTAPKTALCVCPPLDKGSSTTTLSMLFNYLGQPPYIGRGVEQACRAPLNKALCSALRISARTLADVPARSFTSCDSTFPLFDSWSFMFPPPNLSFAADLSRQFTTADMQPSQAKQSMFKHFQVVGLFAMLFYRLPSQRGNCVN